MYAPSIGAWLSARITADPPMRYSSPQLQRRSTLDHTAAAPAYHHDLRDTRGRPSLVLDWLPRTTGNGMTGLGLR